MEEDFEYEYLEAGGLTDIGAALKELNSKLSRHAFLNSMTGALMPVIIFMTDGYATDDYSKTLEEIRKNRWFARGTKIGFALGDDPDLKMLSSVVGNSEAVIKTTDLDLFKRLMKFVLQKQQVPEKGLLRWLKRNLTYLLIQVCNWMTTNMTRNLIRQRMMTGVTKNGNDERRLTWGEYIPFMKQS